MGQKKLHTRIVLIYCTLALLNTAYFAYYQSLLGLHVTRLWLFFLLLTVGSWFMLFLLFKNKLWLTIHLITIILFYIYALINFAYFVVFDTYLAPTLSQARGTSFVLIKFLSQFSQLVPLSLYLSTALVIIITIGLYLYIYKKHNQKSLVKDILHIDYLQKHSISTPEYRINLTAIVILALISNVAVFGVHINAYNNPKDSWWDQREYLSDLGIHGFLYQQFFGKSNTSIVDLTSSIMLNKANAHGKSLTPSEEISQLIQTLPINKGNVQEIEHKTYKRPNIIIYQLESVGNWIGRLQPNPLKNLWKLQNENITVGQFYANSCDTLNAEFSTLCSALPDSYDPVNYSYLKNDFNCLPKILDKEKGYRTALFHSGNIEFYDRNILSELWGFQEKYFDDYFNYKEPDTTVIEKAINKLTETPSKPFFAYIIGFSAHSPHNQEMVDYYQKHFNVTIPPYTGDIPKSISDTIEVNENTTKMYASFVTYVDQSIKFLFDELDRKNLSNNTIVIIQADHRYYNFYSDNDIANFYNYNQLPFMIYVPQNLKGQIKKIASHIDIAPTILDLLNMPKPVTFVGESLFSADHPQNAITKCLSKIDYVDENVVIHGNVRTNKYRTLRKYSSINEQEIKKYYNRLIKLINTSDYFIQENKLTEGLNENQTEPR